MSLLSGDGFQATAHEHKPQCSCYLKAKQVGINHFNLVETLSTEENLPEPQTTSEMVFNVFI